MRPRARDEKSHYPCAHPTHTHHMRSLMHRRVIAPDSTLPNPYRYPHTDHMRSHAQAPSPSGHSDDDDDDTLSGSGEEDDGGSGARGGSTSRKPCLSPAGGVVKPRGGGGGRQRQSQGGGLRGSAAVKGSEEEEEEGSIPEVDTKKARRILANREVSEARM